MEDRYLNLKAAGMYCGGRSPRWARRHLLGSIPYIDLPGSGALFDVQDVDAFLKQHRREPVNVDETVAQIFGLGKRR